MAKYPLYESLTWPDWRQSGRAVFVSHQPQRKALHWAVCEHTPQGGELNLANYGSLRSAVQHAMLESHYLVLQEPS